MFLFSVESSTKGLSTSSAFTTQSDSSLQSSTATSFSQSTTKSPGKKQKKKTKLRLCKVVVYNAIYRSAQENSANKNPQTRNFEEIRVSSRMPFLFLRVFAEKVLSRNFAQIICENSRRHLRNVNRETLMNLN